MQVRRINILTRFIQALENPEVPFLNCLLSFLFAIALRIFAESYSQTFNYFNAPIMMLSKNIIHFYLCFIALAMMFICFFRFVTHTTIEKAARVVFTVFILILMTPLLDLMMTKGQGSDIFYLLPNGHVSVLQSYLSYANHFNGMSFGLRSEIILFLLGCFIYFREKGMNLFLSLFYTWFGYSLIFAIGASPYCIKAIVELFGFNYTYSAESMIHFYLIEMFFLIILLAYMQNKEVTIFIGKNVTSLRFLHWGLTLMLGFFIGLAKGLMSMQDQLHDTDTIIINSTLCLISVFFVWIFGFLINLNIPDKTYKHFAYCSLLVAIFYALMVDLHAFIIITMLAGCAFIYSQPPLQLKRVPFVSQLIVSLHTMVLLILGFILVAGDVELFPNYYFWAILGGGTITLFLIPSKLKQAALVIYNIGILSLISYYWLSKIGLNHFLNFH